MYALKPAARSAVFVGMKPSVGVLVLSLLTRTVAEAGTLEKYPRP